MKIDRKLNLVVPIYEGDNVVSYVHSMPISREVFERYYLVLSRTFSAIYGEGLGFLAGPRVASLVLKDQAKQLGAWEGPEGVEHGLLGEIRRLTNMLVSAPGRGWATITFQEAMDQDALDLDDMTEVENALVFFTVVSVMHRRREVPHILEGACKLWGAQTSSLNCMEFASSLTTSSTAGSTGEKGTPSSIPF